MKSFLDTTMKPTNHGTLHAPIYLIWSGTAGGEHRVVGFAHDMADALKAMTALAPTASASNDEIRKDWPCNGVTEILRTWFDKEARVTRWLRATPTFHALDAQDAASANPRF